MTSGPTYIPSNTDFEQSGWAWFPAETATTEWVSHAHPAALHAMHDPANASWYVCEETWFVGLDALSNDVRGAVGGSEALSGAAVKAARDRFGWPDLHPAQVSGVFPGYPRPREGETDAAFGYRRVRFAAHVDGVLGVGTPKRRFVKEPHLFILGIGLQAGSAPLTVWEGSHQVMAGAFQEALSNSTGPLAEVDVTEAYVAARKICFETCPRRKVPLEPGEAVLLHPMLLHGVAPWAGGHGARIVAYFRPTAPDVATWLQLA